MNEQMNTRLVASLNPEQKQAVLYTEGPLLLLAGAGSGKTRVLTHRIAYLIQKGVDPFNILAITFTNKAAREMRERVDSLTPEGSDVWVATFHSTCVRILRREINKIGYDNSFTIYDADDAERLVKSCIKELNINDKQFPSKSVMYTIGQQKDELISPGQYEKLAGSDYRMAVISRIYSLYQRKLKASNALDFDDIISKTVELFSSRPDVLARYQDRFRYIMVDEYQDTNTSQYKLVELLAEKYKNLCVVGDDDQSIYGWRGANIRNILDFEKDFPNAKVIKLEQNYRSTKVILDSANAVINHNFGRKEKVLWTENPEGCKLKFYKANDENDEGAFICGKIKEKVAEGEKYSDFAVLYRNNAQSRAIEDQLVKNAIPYKLFGGIRFYERMEIKDILSYLRAVSNPFDNVAVMRVINVPKRGIGDTTIDKIAEYAAAHDISFSQALREVENIDGLSQRKKKIDEFIEMMDGFRTFAEDNHIVAIMEKILEDTGYELVLQIEGTDEARARVDNVHELVSKAAIFEKEREDATLEAFLEDVALVADIDNYREGEDAVVLMTLHSSKGLEFDNVFIAGFEEGIFPSYRSITSGELSDLEEERRLCYVGITRAKNVLHLSSAITRMQYGHPVSNNVSRFFKEIPKQYMENLQQPSAPKVSRSDYKAPGERTGVSQFSGVAKSSKLADNGFGGKNYSNVVQFPTPKSVELDYETGSQVRHFKYGVGTVKNIRPAGADYEVTVAFEDKGEKKFMAHLSKLEKV